MPIVKYRNIKFRMATISLIKQVNAIIVEYRQAGYALTLRQVYYQLVAKGVIPNNEKTYKNLGNIISDARLAGLIDWYAIEDRTRFVRGGGGEQDPMDVFTDLDKGYRRDWLEGQPIYVEVWVEKDALIDIVAQICRHYNVPFFSCRGYTSQTEMWNSAMRILEATDHGERAARIIHLGDHDPSGKDMTRDILDRINEFTVNSDCPELDFEINRIALNMDQVKQYDPPPNPAKITDSRADKYIKEFGPDSWELDALNPAILTKLIKEALESYLDLEMIEEVKKREEEERNQIREVMAFAENKDDYINLEDGEHDDVKEFVERQEDFFDRKLLHTDIRDHMDHMKNWMRVDECNKKLKGCKDSKE